MTTTKILRLDSGAAHDGSVTRSLGDAVVERLGAASATTVTTRDLTAGLPFVDGAWVGAAANGEGTAASDELVDELLDADVVVITAPIYNFGVPASLKAWIDQVSRAGRTFQYSEDGPKGLITGTRAVIVTASGGTEVEGEADFAVPYLRFVLGFLGITDVHVVAASQQMLRGEVAVVEAREAIERVLPLAA
ncbi:MAG: NAD(P)H-dependent oxidoreductase [Actinomycetota bacterium]